MTPPKALITKERDPRDYVRGISSQIVPTINLGTGNWSIYLPSNEPQKYKFDTDECSQLSAINIVETQCNWLKVADKFSPEALQFFSDNGYYDVFGNFAFSERFTGTLSNTTINGNSITSAWDCMRKYGLLPRSDLNYTDTQSEQFLTQESMCADYYDKVYITQQMKDKAIKILNYIQIQYEWVSNISKALTQAPIHIGVPVCVDNWNQIDVPFCGSTQPAHCVEIYAENSEGYLIRDQYNPYNKILDKSYFIPQAILGVITPIIPTPTPTPPNNDIIGQELSLIQRVVLLLRQLFNKKS